MSISGVGTPAPVPPPVPPVTAPSPTDRAPTEAAKPAAASTEKKSEVTRAEEEAAKLPPMKGLTLNEVRVMLGAIPASAALKLANRQDGTGTHAFDVYA
jgi:hypothetical protein